MSEALAALQDQSFARATSTTAASYPPERRLAGPQLAGYLDRRVFARDRVPSPRRPPHAAMSAFVRRGTAFWLPTAADRCGEPQRARRALADHDRHRGRPRRAHSGAHRGAGGCRPGPRGPPRRPGCLHRRLGSHLDRLRPSACSPTPPRAPCGSGACARSPGRRRSVLSATMARKRYTSVLHEPGVGEDREADDDRGEVGHQHQSIGGVAPKSPPDVPEHLGLVAGALIV